MPFPESLDVMGDGSREVTTTAGRCSHLRDGLLERRQLPGVGDRSQLAKTTDQVLAVKQRMPVPVILFAHDPTAAQLLLRSAQ